MQLQRAAVSHPRPWRLEQALPAQSIRPQANSSSVKVRDEPEKPSTLSPYSAKLKPRQIRSLTTTRCPAIPRRLQDITTLPPEAVQLSSYQQLDLA